MEEERFNFTSVVGISDVIGMMEESPVKKG